MINDNTSNISALIEQVTLSKKYAHICHDTIAGIAAAEYPKHKDDKTRLKAVKNKLHQISGSFLTEKEISCAGDIITTTDWNNKQGRDSSCRALLAMHTSTRERLLFFELLYRDIFSITGKPDSIIDIACGFNAFALPLLQIADNVQYLGFDISLKAVSLINHFFAAMQINGKAEGADALYSDLSKKQHHNLALLFKILPLLERQQKGYGAKQLSNLNADYIAISFPTKTMSGKSVGMAQSYNAYMLQTASEAGKKIVYQSEYSNEMLFILTD